VVHIGTFLRQQIGCEQTHNPNAYTFLLHPLKFKQFTATSDGHRGAQI